MKAARQATPAADHRRGGPRAIALRTKMIGQNKLKDKITFQINEKSGIIETLLFSP